LTVTVCGDCAAPGAWIEMVNVELIASVKRTVTVWPAPLVSAPCDGLTEYGLMSGP
jgi:hypothetical protein